MLEVLQFIFQDFWHWLGTVIILAVIASSFGGLIKFSFPNVRATYKKKEGTE